MTLSVMDLIKDLKCVAIIGTCKNAGKTTVLNHIISKSRSQFKLGLSSIGFDGEERDHLTGGQKPKIYISSGTILATARDVLSNCDFTKEILMRTDYSTSLGEVVILQAQSDGYVQLAGPAIGKQMSGLCLLLKRFGCSKILIDGALDRKSSATIGIADGCILSTGACISSNLIKTIDDTVHIVNMLTLKEFENKGLARRFHTILSSADVGIVKEDGTIVLVKNALSDKAPSEIVSLLDRAEYVLIKGVVTARFMEGILKLSKKLEGIKFVVEDGTRLFFDDKLYIEFILKGGSIEVLKRINLTCVTVNPTSLAGYNFDTKKFVDKLTQRINLPVIDVVGGGHYQIS